MLVPLPVLVWRFNTKLNTFKKNGQNQLEKRWVSLFDQENGSNTGETHELLVNLRVGICNVKQRGLQSTSNVQQAHNYNNRDQ